jgi:DNA mismatch repair ATPase MutL
MISNAPNYNQRNIAREIQFFSVNGRPVDLPKVSKLLSEVWRNFNSNEGTKRRPACMLCLYLPNSMFDVNIAPDKREVFIANDNEIYEIVRQELHKVWSLQTEGTFVANLVEKESNSNTTNRQVENPYTDSKNMPTPSCHGTNRPHEEIGRESSVAVAVAPTASGRRMMRRNAFINRFDNIGKATTDFHHAKIKDISLQNDDNVDKLDATFAHNNSDGQRTNESRIESPVLKKLRHHNDDSSPDRRNSSPDKRIWAQARLSFLVRESRSQVEDILQLKSMETNANIDDRNNQTSERYKHAESNQSATSSKPQSIGDGKNTLSKSQHSTRHVSQEEIIIKNQTQKMDDGSKDEKSQNATRYVSQDQIVVAAKSSIYNDRPQPQAANVADTTSMKDEMPSNFEEGTHLKKRPLISTIQSNSSTETINPHDSKMIPTPSCHGTKRPHEEIGHESSVAVAPTASGRQMMRRNAFINRFDNVGEATTDFHHTKSMKDRMPSNFEKGTHLKNRPLNVTIQSNSSTETINPRDLHSKSDQSATKKVAYSSTTAESDSIIMEECDEENEEKNECDDKVKEESSNDDLDKEKGHRIVVWDAFQSTAAVIEQADVARINKMKRCEKLKEMKVSRSKVNDDTEQDENNKGNVVKLSKEEFLTMTIVGQFNRGFILALCEKGQLWVCHHMNLYPHLFIDFSTIIDYSFFIFAQRF